MRDYLYIPLGGNRVSAKRLYFNLWMVFLISGLWHGAAWTFVIWGGFHGLFLVLDRLFLLRFFKFIGKIPSIAITFLISLVGWVFFRADDFTAAIKYLTNMFSFEFTKDDYEFNSKFYSILIIAVFFAFWGGFRKIENWQVKLFSENKRLKTILPMFGVSIIILIISLGSIVSSGFNPFIYFRF